MILENFSLLEFNTFGINVKSKRFARFSNIEELRTILNKRNNDPLLILGGGSNILLTKDFQGLTLKNEIKGYQIISEDDKNVYVKVGAGEIWHDFVLKNIANNYGGTENLSLIPGSVGASPMQNIGAYGVEIKDIFVELEAYHIKTGEIHTFSHEDCKFEYRESIFKQEKKGEYIITSVTFRLTKQHQINVKYGAILEELQKKGISQPTIKDVSNAIIAIRTSKLPDPKEIGNSGSFFKNPVVDVSILNEIKKTNPTVPNYPAPNGKVKLAAGWLIEKTGWKGKRIDNYGVHQNQALVLVNYGGSTGTEIYDLSTKIIADVEKQFGVRLEREVNII